jgi:hypothetical protein
VQPGFVKSPLRLLEKNNISRGCLFLKKKLKKDNRSLFYFAAEGGEMFSYIFRTIFYLKQFVIK